MFALYYNVGNRISTEEFENNGIEYKSLDKAIEACLEAKNEAYLIHIGYWNLDYYKKGDTFESLKARCENIIKENNLK